MTAKKTKTLLTKQKVPAPRAIVYQDPRLVAGDAQLSRHHVIHGNHGAAALSSSWNLGECIATKEGQLLK